jgi:hypothetical protein
VASDVLKQLKDRRHFSLGQQMDLQVEVASFIALTSEPVLA